MLLLLLLLLVFACSVVAVVVFFTTYYEKVPLEAVPYSEEYGEHLSGASKYLKEVILWFSLVDVWRRISKLFDGLVSMCSLLIFIKIEQICLKSCFPRQLTRLTTLLWLNS